MKPVIALTHLWQPFSATCAFVGAALLCGWVVNRQAFLIAEGGALLLLIGGAFPWILIYSCQTIVKFPHRRATAGEMVPISVSIDNRGWWELRAISLHLPNDSTIQPLPTVARRSRQVDSTFIPLLQRGWIGSENLRIATRWPFGLVTATRHPVVESPILVWPDPAPISEAFKRCLQESLLSETHTNRFGDFSDFSGIRPYRQGDSLRRVHWVQTARLDRIMVTEHHTCATPEVTIYLDLDEAIHVGTGKDSTFEWAIRIAAGIINQVLRERGFVTLHLGNERPQGNAGSGGRHLLMDTLAVATPIHGSPLAKCLRRIKSRGRLIVITTDIADRRCTDSRFSPEWVLLRADGFTATRMIRQHESPHDAHVVMTSPGIWSENV